MYSKDISTLDRFRGCLLGLAIGDAVGTTVEFMQRGSFPKVVDMVGGGPFHLQPGQWTDDTSMALCLATSLVTKKGFDANDQMGRYWRWYKEGYLSSTGEFFDIGNTVRDALERYHQTRNSFSGSTSPNMAGNGSLMRLAPIPIFYFPDLQQILHFAAESSRTTHGATECLEACQLFSEMLFNAFSVKDKESVLFKTTFEPSMPKIKEIAFGNYRDKHVDEIKGSGYVVESLEAALWCFYRAASFEETILQAANLGDDADTTAAICGQIAGAFYGETGIPEKWLNKLHMRREITEFTDRLLETSEDKT
ncbi:MAG TPA: ADP-ribosylglycohydrolase family protein [Anaerolineales bacterium]|nr:ADP-ribosylglycohydrolase family protein [Anaerolineales bacterium]